eukprot:jgi/Tetstr1/421076/TSEL_012121.t1
MFVGQVVGAIPGVATSDNGRGILTRHVVSSYRWGNEEGGVAARTMRDVGGSWSEWEYERSDEEDDLELSPTAGRVLTVPEGLVKHRTVERGAAYCLPCVAGAEAFTEKDNTDVDGGQPTGLLDK